MERAPREAVAIGEIDGEEKRRGGVLGLSPGAESSRNYFEKACQLAQLCPRRWLKNPELIKPAAALFSKRPLESIAREKSYFKAVAILSPPLRLSSSLAATPRAASPRATRSPPLYRPLSLPFASAFALAVLTRS